MIDAYDLARKAVARDLFGIDALVDAEQVVAPPSYELVRPLGRGGTGIVYLARDRQLNRPVALKFLRDGRPAVVERFRREARFTARLDNPRIVKVYQLHESEGSHPCIAMQYIDGSHLAYGRLDDRRLVQVLRDVADALADAHEQGIVHRDIKPANILLDGRGEPHVTDFGIARDVWQRDGHATLSEAGQLIGTPAAMSPEQARGELHAIDARSDVYSLGASFFYLLTGRWPFEGDNVVDVLHAIIHGEPPFPRALKASVPRALEAIVLKCLQKERGDRYQSMSEVRDELDQFLRGAAVTSESTAWFGTLVRKMTGRPAAVPAPVPASEDPDFQIGVEVARELAEWDADRYRLSRNIHKTFQRLDAIDDRLGQYLATRPDAAWARFYRAAALFRRGRLEAALEEMERAINRASHLPSAYFELGRVYLASHLRQQHEARKHITRVGVEGHLREVRSQLDRAVLAFEEARRLNPDLPRWQLKYADAIRCLAHNDFEGCVRECDQILADEPDAEEVWKLRGDALQLAHRDPFESYDRALMIRRSYWEACLAKAAAHFSRGDVAHVRESIEQALVIHPECVDALVLLARTFAGEDPARAIELAERAVSIDARHYEAQVTRAELHLAHASASGDEDHLACALDALERAQSLPGCQNRVNLIKARVLVARAELHAARGQDPRIDLEAVLAYQDSEPTKVPDNHPWLDVFARAHSLLGES